MFAFRLCLALGYPHPDVLLRRISGRQLVEWMAFYSLDPWGERRADIRSGLLGTLIGAGHGKKLPLSAFMLFEKEAEDAEKSKQQKVEALRAWFEQKAKQSEAKKRSVKE